MVWENKRCKYFEIRFHDTPMEAQTRKQTSLWDPYQSETEGDFDHLDEECQSLALHLIKNVSH